LEFTSERVATTEYTTTREVDGYDGAVGVVVLTFHKDDPHNEIPKGNSDGYRVTLEQLDQVRPGERVSTPSRRSVRATQRVCRMFYDQDIPR